MSLRIAASSAASASTSSLARRLLSSSARLAQAPTPPPSLPRSHYLAKTVAPRTPLEAYRRYPNHPLNAFFQIKQATIPDPAAGVKPDGSPKSTMHVSLPVTLVHEDTGPDSSRRSWTAPELRRKSSMELHQLWYLMLMEKNRLATKWAELRRHGLLSFTRSGRINIYGRMRKVKASMARLKLVLNERRLALLDAKSTERARLALAPTLTAKTHRKASNTAPVPALKETKMQRSQDVAFEKMRRQDEGAEHSGMPREGKADQQGVPVGVEQQQQHKNKKQ